MRTASSFFLFLFLMPFSRALYARQTDAAAPKGGERTDSAAIARIKVEEKDHSEVMNILSWLTDVCGSRLTGSPGYKRSLEWTQQSLRGWGLENVHLEGWGPFGRGWYLNKYAANITAPMPFPLLSCPKAWSPGTRGTVEGGVLFLSARTDSALQTYHGKLKGKFVLIGEPTVLKAHFEPDASRQSDSTLLALANADANRPRRRSELSSGRLQMLIMQTRQLKFCFDEKATAALSTNRGDDGTIFVQSAIVPDDPEKPYEKMTPAYSTEAPETLPQVVLAAEHFNRLVRMIDKGESPRLEMNLVTTFTRQDSAYNVIAELPGSDLKDEVVMIGAHIDSWHSGTGGTDNGTGVATCMEAMRILKKLGLAPRRTIRLALWAAEEQGLLGSRAYVKQHFGEQRDSSGPRAIGGKPEREKFSVYFNNDNGTGKIRGVYMQGNEATRPIFRSWFSPFRSEGASTLSSSSTGGTDHVSFDAAGLPGFQFVQDDIEYFQRTWHSNMDVYDRAQEEDLKEASTIIAAFAYNAAMRNGQFPRKAQ